MLSCSPCVLNWHVSGVRRRCQTFWNRTGTRQLGSQPACSGSSDSCSCGESARTDLGSSCGRSRRGTTPTSATISVIRAMTKLGLPRVNVTNGCFFFKNWANPGLFFVCFRSFQTNNTIFNTNQCEKMSCPSSIRRRDSNPRPLKCESPPITTRPIMTNSCSGSSSRYIWK